MSRVACSRSWEAEATEEGRLPAEDAAAFMRHAGACSDCARELRDLARLREVMPHASAPEALPLVSRRMRIAVLRRVAQSRTRRSFDSRAAFAALALAAIVLIAWGLRRTLHHRAALVVANGSEPRFEVTEVVDAARTKYAQGGSVRIAFARGSAVFRVFPLAAGEQFVINAPDARIEVRGTRFVVDVRDGHLQSVVVSEGVVSVEPASQTAFLVSAGDRWDAPAVSAISTSAEPARTPAPSSTLSVPAVSPSAGLVRPRPAIVRDVLSDAGGAPAAVDANELFAAALRSFQSGAYAEADARLAHFERAHPADGRAEDVAFMRAVAHARMGDARGAAALARAYLQRFPQGLRRVDAEGLLGRGADGGS